MEQVPVQIMETNSNFLIFLFKLIKDLIKKELGNLIISNCSTITVLNLI